MEANRKQIFQEKASKRSAERKQNQSKTIAMRRGGTEDDDGKMSIFRGGNRQRDSLLC